MIKSLKEKTHKWIMKRAKNPKPLPGQDQIRREIGFDLAEAHRAAKEREQLKK